MIDNPCCYYFECPATKGSICWYLNTFNSKIEICHIPTVCGYSWVFPPMVLTRWLRKAVNRITIVCRTYCLLDIFELPRALSVFDFYSSWLGWNEAFIFSYLFFPCILFVGLVCWIEIETGIFPCRFCSSPVVCSSLMDVNKIKGFCSKLRVFALAFKGGFSGMPEFGLFHSGLVFLIK